MEYLKIKKGGDYAAGYHRAKVLEVYRNFVLGKVYDPSMGFMYFDIMVAVSDPNEGIKFNQSPGNVGLKCDFPDAPGTPLSEAEIRTKWENFIASIERTERSHAETDAGNKKREEIYIARKRKAGQAQERRKYLQIEIKKIVAECETANDFIKNKKAQKLVAETQMCNLFTANI